MTKSPSGWTRQGRLSGNGGNGSSRTGCQGSKNNHGGAAPDSFPPGVVVEIKALACQLPHEHGLPLSRLSIAEIQREAVNRGLVASIGETTLWQWLNEDAIRPWYHRSWIFPRDPDFQRKAGQVLDLYEGLWEGKRLRPNDCVISADEKTSIQARRHKHPSKPPGPGQLMRVEHEYKRLGAWAYLAAWDVRRAKIFGRCERKSCIASFDRLVEQVMSQEPYRSARRVFWLVDNGSIHRGPLSAERLRSRWRNIVLVHTPVHASWLNQIEIFFSVVQRKVLTPCDFGSLDELEERLLAFQQHYEQVAKPFEWKFTRKDLEQLLLKLAEGSGPISNVA